ncbi:MAG TPA: DUF433 domain-containing protein [Longimicrobiales bacterium]|nr:DUF433 domain-containing protein [Longimicrobiales bacterium]
MFPEASRATGIPATTLRAWVAGQRYRTKDSWTRFAPVLRRPSDDDSRLSFLNLIEAHVLRALRQRHAVRLESIRQAIAIAEREHGIERLLVDPRLKTSAGKLFLDRYYDLVELTPSQQFAMRVVLERYLERIEYGPDNLPARFFPFERIPDSRTERVISLSPFIAFGKSVVERRGVSTRKIAERLDAGESRESLIDDYEITETEFEEAVLYEAA